MVGLTDPPCFLLNSHYLCLTCIISRLGYYQCPQKRFVPPTCNRDEFTNGLTLDFVLSWFKTLPSGTATSSQDCHTPLLSPDYLPTLTTHRLPQSSICLTGRTMAANNCAAVLSLRALALTAFMSLRKVFLLFRSPFWLQVSTRKQLPPHFLYSSLKFCY